MCVVFCERRITVKKKGMIYKTVVYGAETRPIKKAQEKRLYVTEMRMLHWMCGITRRQSEKCESKRYNQRRYI